MILVAQLILLQCVLSQVVDTSQRQRRKIQMNLFPVEYRVQHSLTSKCMLLSAANSRSAGTFLPLSAIRMHIELMTIRQIAGIELSELLSEPQLKLARYQPV